MSPTPLNAPEPGENVFALRGRDLELRTPPSNVAAEHALLGAILLNNKSIDQVIDFLKPEHFTDPAAERVYAAAVKLIENGSAANVVTLSPFMSSDEILIAAGGTKYLAALSSPLALASNVRDYGQQILDLYIRRQIIETCRQSIEGAFRPDIDSPAKQILEEAEEQLFILGSSTERHDSLSSISESGQIAVDLAQIAHKRGGHLSGVTTGLTDIDRQMGGLHPSDLIIIAGRPSMGKTALATAIAFNAAKYFKTTDRSEHQGKQVAFFSLEMSADQLANRVLAHVANVDSHRIRTGRLTNDEMTRLVQAQSELHGIPLQIDDQPGATVGAIRTRCRRLARRKGSKGLGLVVVDYLQLMDSLRDDKMQGRVNELGAMTRGLKKLAKDLNVPVVALSQLSRAVEQRDDKRPQLADLRESGTIEQDSDVVMFVYREEYYLSRGEPKKGVDESDDRFNDRYHRWTDRTQAAAGIAEIQIAKQRHGPIGTIKAHFEASTTWFSNLETAHYEPVSRPIQGMD